jgi:hypothetical protein
MRVAEICPNCATYINASCILYDGDYLSTLDVSELDSLDEILSNINDTFTALSGAGEPASIPTFIGQLYINTSGPELWIGMGTSSVNWGFIADISTTTTTTTAP